MDNEVEGVTFGVRPLHRSNRSSRSVGCHWWSGIGVHHIPGSDQYASTVTAVGLSVLQYAIFPRR